MTGARTAALRGLLLLASLFFTLCIAEIGVRLLRPGWQPSTAARTLFWDPHPTRGWAHRPDTRGRFRGPSWDVQVRINALGLRDDDAQGYARTDRRRVLLLGDSFAWGFGVEQDEVLGAVLEAQCPDWEVLNAAVSGYSTDQQLLFFREEGVRYSPDLVIVLMHENDLAGNAHARAYGYEKPYFETDASTGLVARNTPVPARSALDVARTWLVAHSYLVHGLTRRMGGWREYRVANGSDPHQTTRAILEALAREVRASGAELRLVLVPASKQTTAFLRRAAFTANIAFVDLAPSFAMAHRRGEPLHLAHDEHWNAAGHAVAAQRIAQMLDCEEG